MKSNAAKQLRDSINKLDHALTFKKKAAKDPFYFAGIAKTFESCFEYAWEYFKQRAIAEGFEVYSPKEAIKRSGQLALIDDVERWLQFLNDRNLAVHDYLGLTEDDYLKTIEAFAQAVKKIPLA